MIHVWAAILILAFSTGLILGSLKNDIQKLQDKVDKLDREVRNIRLGD